MGFEGDGGAAVGLEGTKVADTAEEFGSALALGLEFGNGRYVPKDEGLVEVSAKRRILSAGQEWAVSTSVESGSPAFPGRQ